MMKTRGWHRHSCKLPLSPRVQGTSERVALPIDCLLYKAPPAAARSTAPEVPTRGLRDASGRGSSGEGGKNRSGERKGLAIYIV